jgi:predicted transcriptional regulator
MTPMNIQLPAEHHRRLQQIADAEGSSIVDVIADFIRAAIEVDRIPDELPGWAIERTPRGVHFAALDAEISTTLRPAVAAGLADAFDRLSIRGATAKAVLDLDAGLKVERRGTSVRLTDISTGNQRAVARSVAREIAHKLRDAAA